MTVMKRGFYTKNIATDKSIPNNYLLHEVRIITELLNTYLAVRIGEGKQGWAKLDVTNPPAEGVQHDKLVIVTNLVKALPDSYLDSSDRWFAFINKLAELEENERIAKDATAARPFGTWLTSPFIKHDSLLERTLFAIRIFIIEQYKIANSSSFEYRKEHALDEMKLIEGNLATAKLTRDADKAHIADLEKSLNVSTRKYKTLVEAETSLYHHQYFKDVIKLRDQHKDKNGVSPLDETCFKDFCDNVVNGKRSSELLNKLLLAMSLNTAPLQNASTSSTELEYIAPKI